MFDIHGVVPPIITPFDSAGRPEPEAFGRLVDWYAASGCQGLWVCGGTGEGVSLSCDERLAMVEMASEAASERLKIVFHVGGPTTSDALAAARRCQELEVDAISSVPPYFFGKSEDEVVDFYRRLGDECDRPLFLYNLPDATGVALHARLVERIVRAVPTVVGIKHSAPNLDAICELLDVLPELIILVGRGELLLPALTLGAVGSVCASLCLAPARFVEVYRAFEERDLDRAIAAQRDATLVKRLYHHFPVIAATKRVNQEQIGMPCGSTRGPLAPLPPDQETALLEMADSLGLFDSKPGGVERRSMQAVRPR